MTATTAADRLDDSFPHGTPAGYRLGCRGNGGCPNRDTSRMTCKEADLRYRTDLTYRRAIDAGNLPLDRETPRTGQAERIRTQRDHRGGLAFGKEARGVSAGAQVAARDAQIGYVPHRDRATTVDETPDLRAAADFIAEHAVDRAEPRDDLPTVPVEAPAIDVHAEEARGADIVDARVQLLEEQLANVERAKTRAEEIAALAGQERAAALAAVSDLQRTLDQQAQPIRRPAIEVRRDDLTGGLLVSFTALLSPDTVRALADHLASAS